jgi:hypothetical protein
MANDAFAALAHPTRHEHRDVLPRNSEAVRDSPVMYGKQAALLRYAR